MYLLRKLLHASSYLAAGPIPLHSISKHTTRDNANSGNCTFIGISHQHKKRVGKGLSILPHPAEITISR
jgi:hypothetical protein